MQWELITGGILILAGSATIAFLALKKTPEEFADKKEINSLVEKSSYLISYDGATLIQNNKLEPLIAQCRDRMGFDFAIFKNDCLPLIYRSAEWVQMLPASESHHHAQPGGLLLHMLESASIALRLRQGYLLPVGAAPEEIPERKHRWTYAVFLAAILHDIGRPIADIQIKLKDGSAWQPLAGSMIEQGISHYKLSFELKKRDYELHKRLPIILFQRLVPNHVLSWLAQDADLMKELTSYLSGEDANAGAIKEIITKADSESVRQNLMLGPRTRFAAAKTVPLIERLMEALRLMLDEGRFSLNRAGAHGWVYDEKLWFVSKRVADDVRQFLIERESAEGIPGSDKNDRIFDTWQEYGALITTPDNKAIWNVNVAMDDGWSKDFTVICFPLSKLYKNATHYPKEMPGRITVNTATSINSDIDVADEQLLDAQNEVINEASNQPIRSEPVTEVLVTENHTEPVSINDFVETPTIIESYDAATAIIEPNKEVTSSELPTFEENVIEAPVETKAPSMKLINKNVLEQVFLDEEDIAKPVPKLPKTKKNIELGDMKPMVPHDAKTLPSVKGKKIKPPHIAALKFMRWIQQGISDGSIAYNRTKAEVHFMEEGMLLVNPAIFKRFASMYGEDASGDAGKANPGELLGDGIRRHVTDAGWHVQVGPKKFNFLKYRIIGMTGKGDNKLSVVVIKNPSQFISPLPENNPTLLRETKLDGES